MSASESVDATKKTTETVVKEPETAAAAPAGVDEEEDQTNLIVNYLPQHVSEERLREMFSKFGELEHVKLMLDKGTRQSMGYGFVKYVKPESAAAAIDALNGYQMDNKKLRVGYSHPRSEANVYVGNLKPDVSKEKLEELFARFGPVIECKILMDQETGQSKGCGFVKFENVNHAKDAINGLSGMLIEDLCLRPLTVKFARKHEKPHHTHYQRQPAPRFRPAPRAAPSEPVEYSGFCLFVYNLPKDVNNDTLRKLFAEFGNITHANVMLDFNGSCRGFGFVNFEKKEDAQKAITGRNGFVYKNNPLSVSFKSDKTDKRR